MRIGTHCPISGGFLRSIEHLKNVGGNTMQIFSGNPRSWKKSLIEGDRAHEFTVQRLACDIKPLLIHAGYLSNMASPDRNIQKKSAEKLKEELIRASMLEADYIVLHPGSFKDSTREKGLNNIANALKKILQKKSSTTQILLENTSGQGNTIGADLNELLLLRKELENSIFFCIDTAHAFQAGYSVREMLEHPAAEFTRAVHINDSKSGYGSRLDLHENIGKGKIGLDSFTDILNYPPWRNLPFILETPQSVSSDKTNISLLKSLIKKV